ncbi:unnamed protein product, partial [Allacma fusca]
SPIFNPQQPISNSSPDLIEDFEEVSSSSSTDQEEPSTSTALTTMSNNIVNGTDNKNSTGHLSDDEIISEVLRKIQASGVSGQMSRSIPSHLDDDTVADGADATRGTSFVKRHFRPNNLKLV